MKRITLFVMSALLVTGVAAAAGNADLDIDKVNGSIHVPDNATVGKLSTVNGSIHVGDGAHAADASTVNGSIHLGANVTIDALDTVNGGIHVGAGTKIAKTIEAVNGSISLAAGTDVAGKVSNVNGGIALTAAHVGGGIETTSGDIDIGANSRVDGGILVNQDNSWFHFGVSRDPRVVIGPHAVVQGDMVFKRTVQLYVSDSATVGKIEGAKPVTFTGDKPPQ
ncbi:MAG: hypothetical protein DYH18_12740 [Xanthomonadales bacterium PRO7]|jgi:DUF4097 and DUF4098 domain-containing protein YvlB|nr:hypothetical protein [Xanthomonadales bacterium PRO7]HMM57924.1 hypothetical protein [Rudaea sp.]